MFFEEDVEPWQKDLKSWKNRRKSSTKSFDHSESIDDNNATSFGIYNKTIDVNSNEGNNTKNNKHAILSKKWNKYPMNEEEDGWTENQVDRLESPTNFDKNPQNRLLTSNNNDNNNLNKSSVFNDEPRKVEKIIKICQSRSRKSFGFEVDRTSDGLIVISKIVKGSSADICELRVADVLLSLNQHGVQGREVQDVRNVIEESVSTGNLVLKIERILASDDTDDDDVDNRNVKSIETTNGNGSLFNKNPNIGNNNDAISRHDTARTISTTPTKLHSTVGNVNNLIDDVKDCSINDSVDNIDTPPPPLPSIPPPHLSSVLFADSTRLTEAKEVSSSVLASFPASPPTPQTASSSFPSPPTSHQLNSPFNSKDNTSNSNNDNKSRVNTLISHDDKKDKNSTVDKFNFFGLDSSCSEELKALKDNKSYVSTLESLNDKTGKSLKVNDEKAKRGDKTMMDSNPIEPNSPDKPFKSNIKLNLFTKSLNNESKNTASMDPKNVEKSAIKNNHQITSNVNSVSKLAFEIKKNSSENNEAKLNKDKKYDLGIAKLEGKFPSVEPTKEENEMKLKKYQLELERMKEMEKVEKIKLERLKEEKKLEVLKKRRLEEEREIERLKRIAQQEKQHNFQNQPKPNILKNEVKKENMISSNNNQSNVENGNFKVPFEKNLKDSNKMQHDTTNKHHYYRQHNNTNIDDVIDDINKKSERTLNEMFSNLPSKTPTADNKTNMFQQQVNTPQNIIIPHQHHEHLRKEIKSQQSSEGNAYSRIVSEALKEAGLENDRYVVEKIVVENKPYIQAETRQVEKSEINMKLNQANKQLNNKFNMILGNNQKNTKAENEFLRSGNLYENKNKMDKSIKKLHINDARPINRTTGLNHDNNNNFEFNNLGKFIDNNNVKNKSDSDWLFNYHNNPNHTETHVHDNYHNGLNNNQPYENAYENMNRNNLNGRPGNVTTQNETNISYLLYGDESNKHITSNNNNNNSNNIDNNLISKNSYSNNNMINHNNNSTNDNITNTNILNKDNGDKNIPNESDKRQLKDFKRYFSKNWLITEVSARMNKSQKDNQKSPTKNPDFDTTKNSTTSPSKPPHTSPFFKPFKNLTFNKEQKKQTVSDKVKVDNLEPSKGPYRLRCPSDNTFNIRSQSPTFNRINKNLVDISYESKNENSFRNNDTSVDANNNQPHSTIYDNVRIENNLLGNRSKSLSSDLVDKNTSETMSLQYNKKLYNPYYNSNQKSYLSPSSRENDFKVTSYTLNRNQNIASNVNNNNLVNSNNRNEDFSFDHNRNAQNFYIKSGPMPYKKPDPKRLSLASNFQ